MTKKLLLFLFLCPFLANAQTFSNTTWTAIPNNATDLYIPIAVSGLPTTINSSFGIESVCLNITHQYVSELVVELQSPTGTLIILSSQKGGSGSGYLNTCFQENGTHGYVNGGVAPFSGSYYPEQTLNAFNDGQDPNGTWNLILRDVFVPADTGSFHSISVTFGLNPPADPASGGPCSTGNPAGCQCPDGISSNCDLLPDMTASAMIIQGQHHEYTGNITVANATPNIGWGPLEVRGTSNCFCDVVQVPCSTSTCPDGSSPKQLINQRIYHRNGTTMTSYDRPAGTMSYHPSHGHMHVDDWSLFSLRVPTPNPDASTWPIVGTGNKISFCLVNLGDCDTYTGYCADANGNVIHKSDIPNADFGVVSGCTSTEQGIRVANLDIYGEGLNGMGIVLPPDICNEQYYIVSITDFNNNFLETDETNNWAKVPITLTQQLSNDHFQASGFIYTLAGTRVDVFANAANPDSMVWAWGDGTFSTTTGVLTNHTYASAGTYTIYSYAYNHCGPAVGAETITIVPVGMNNPLETVAAFNAYPNPGKGNTWLTYTLVNKSNVTLEVFDQLGKVVKTMVNEDQIQGKYRYQFDPVAENLPAGVYFARLTTADKAMNLRLVMIQ